jgi:acid phosphatase type 7
VAIGNHEVRGGYNGKIPDDAPYFYSLFALPEDRSYYALDFGKYLSLVILDSGHTQPIDGAQSDWLRQAMTERTQQQFLFTCYHYPAYGTTKAPTNGTPLDAKQSVAIREHWVPTLEQFGVTAVFENDHHNYKRTYRIRQHKRDDDNGLLYVGDGAWAVETRTVPKPGTAWWLERAEGRNHVWHVELQPSGQARMRAIDIEGKEFDDVIIKEPRTKPVDP